MESGMIPILVEPSVRRRFPPLKSREKCSVFKVHSGTMVTTIEPYHKRGELSNQGEPSRKHYIVLRSIRCRKIENLTEYS